MSHITSMSVLAKTAGTPATRSWYGTKTVCAIDRASLLTRRRCEWGANGVIVASSISIRSPVLLSVYCPRSTAIIWGRRRASRHILCRIFSGNFGKPWKVNPESIWYCCNVFFVALALWIRARAWASCTRLMFLRRKKASFRTSSKAFQSSRRKSSKLLRLSVNPSTFSDCFRSCV